MELRDVYDENHRLTGKTVSDDGELLPGEYVVAVGIWIFNSHGRVLMTKRSPEKQYAPEKWENTGGHLISGGTSEEAVLRELREETGIQAEKEAITLMNSVKKAPYFGEDYAVRMEVELANVKLQPGETCDVRWATKKEFEAMERAGEIAPAVLSHLAPWRQEWEKMFA